MTMAVVRHESARAQSAAEPQLRVTDSVTETEWDRYVLAHPNGTVDHLWRWRHIFDEVFGHRSVYLAARRGEELAGILPLVCFQSRLFGRFLVSLPFLNY